MIRAPQTTQVDDSGAKVKQTIILPVKTCTELINYKTIFGISEEEEINEAGEFQHARGHAQYEDCEIIPEEVLHPGQMQQNNSIEACPRDDIYRV